MRQWIEAEMSGGSAFPAQTTDGEYHVYIGPQIENLIGQKMDQDHDKIEAKTG